MNSINNSNRVSFGMSTTAARGFGKKYPVIASGIKADSEALVSHGSDINIRFFSNGGRPFVMMKEIISGWKGLFKKPFKKEYLLEKSDIQDIQAKGAGVVIGEIKNKAFIKQFTEKKAYILEQSLNK